MGDDLDKESKKIIIYEPSETDLLRGDGRWQKNHILNDLSVWYPLLVAGYVPTPKTYIVSPLRIRNDKEPFGYNLDPNVYDIIDNIVVNSLGGYPVFIRGSHTSNKHDWKDSCFVSNKLELADHIKNIMFFSSMVDIPFNSIVIRKFLQLDSLFTAFCGMPIGREYRFFVENGEITHEQPYWPPDALRDHVADSNLMMCGLRDINDMTKPIVEEARKLAIKVANIFYYFGGWSVDICVTKDNELYVTDMATAETSYKWDSKDI